MRSGLTAARLSRLRPAFSPEGTATAGNSCGISDGAAVLAVTTADRADGPALRVLGWSVAGTDPALPGLSPVPAVRAVLDRWKPESPSLREMVERRIREALILACEGRPGPAGTAVADAAALADPEQLVGPFLDQPGALGLLRDAGRSGQRGQTEAGEVRSDPPHGVVEQ